MSSEEGKPDISKMLSFIPAASTLYSKQSKVQEKRVKLVYDESVERGSLRISKRLATTLGITDQAEVAVGGKTRLRLKAVIDESTNDDVTIWANPDEMKEHGIADGSTVSVRASR